MDLQLGASLLTVLLLCLFLGTNLGVLIMCLMRLASPPEPEEDLVPGAVREH